jgi:hypothetical protein
MLFPKLAGLEINKNVNFSVDRRLVFLSRYFGIMLLGMWLATYIFWRQGLHLHSFHLHLVRCQQRTGFPEPHVHYSLFLFLDPMSH